MWLTKKEWVDPAESKASKGKNLPYWLCYLIRRVITKIEDDLKKAAKAPAAKEIHACTSSDEE